MASKTHILSGTNFEIVNGEIKYKNNVAIHLQLKKDEISMKDTKLIVGENTVVSDLQTIIYDAFNENQVILSLIFPEGYTEKVIINCKDEDIKIINKLIYQNIKEHLKPEITPIEALVNLVKSSPKTIEILTDDLINSDLFEGKNLTRKELSEI